MRGLICLAVLLCGGVASACDTVSVQCVQPHVAVAQAQVFGVQQFAAVQSYAVVPQAVQVQTFALAVPQAVVVQQHAVRVQNVRVLNVRQPRQVVRSRSVVRSR